MYTIRFDGGSSRNPGPGGSGAVIIQADGNVISELSMGHSVCTNNEAEYWGLIIGLQEAMLQGIQHVIIEGDSLLVINQMLGKWSVNAKNLKPLHAKCKSLLVNFKDVVIHHIPRAQNELADKLSWVKRPVE